MSALTDKAKAEADEAEAENPDETEEEEAAEGEPTPEPEPEPEPEQPPQAMTEQQSEREFGKLERKASTYLEGALAITRKLEIPVQPCPLCTFPGLAIPRQAHEVTSDVEAAVLALIGKGVEPDYKPSQAYARCDVCDGWGDVLTGAQKDVSRTAMCVTCGGKGYVNQVQPTPITTPITPTLYPGATASYTPLPQGTSDAWNRPAGHPHWGLDPAMVGSPNGQQVG
jgi:hypothetical protein